MRNNVIIIQNAVRNIAQKCIIIHQSQDYKKAKLHYYTTNTKFKSEK